MNCSDSDQEVRFPLIQTVLLRLKCSTIELIRTSVLKNNLDFCQEMWYYNINRHPVLIDTPLKKGLNVCLILDVFGLESVKRMLETFLAQLSVPRIQCIIAECYNADKNCQKREDLYILGQRTDVYGFVLVEVY